VRALVVATSTHLRFCLGDVVELVFVLVLGVESDDVVFGMKIDVDLKD